MSGNTKPSKEQRYFDALKQITRYQSVEAFSKNAESRWGLEASEAIAMAYENILIVARQAIKGKRRPEK